MRQSRDAPHRPVTSGTATCTMADPAAGSHWITANYSSDNNYATSTAPGLTQVVNKQATTAALTSSLNPATVGQAVTYTATLNTTAATGTIEFKDNSATITGCSTQTLTSGTQPAPWPTQPPARTGSQLTTPAIATTSARYPPASHKLSTRKPPQQRSSSSLNPSTVGQAVTYTATLSPTAATGTIEFKDNSTTITGCSRTTRHLRHSNLHRGRSSRRLALDHSQLLQR